ncbi:hypothetical protein [Novipirellula rosea]|uniref:Uncharacterized protein n=1 Tax=Novipirellula rosea TaxID=1031540 RepID=A0ABP8NKM6_9BACT
MDVTMPPPATCSVSPLTRTSLKAPFDLSPNRNWWRGGKNANATTRPLQPHNLVGATHQSSHLENDFADIEVERFPEMLKRHGRKDEITSYQMPVPKDLTNR